FDKFVARQLPNKIVACVQKSGLPLEPALLRHRVELWFPHLFLLRQGSPQLPVFQHLASYNLQKSRFYHPKNAALFEDCFAALLAAATEAFAAAKLPFGDVMRGAAANAVATFLLKRMEQRLREHADYPYPLSAIPSKMFKNTAQNQRRLHTFLCADTLANAVDDAVDAFARTHDITPLRAAPRPPKPKKSGTNHKNEAPGLAQEPASPPKPVKINFARLERIRAEAAEMTERLLTEAAEEDVPPAKTPPPLTKNFVGESFYRTLAPAQIAFLEAGRFEDELLVEEINAIALDCFGDTLIEGGKLIEDYENWREL
ncbi:MAG: hypothetical protein LBB50_07105, partial [Oscillospiraceae bacterium]|nr:hypothetical protein [Oscillospiraceae bacterium]